MTTCLIVNPFRVSWIIFDNKVVSSISWYYFFCLTDQSTFTPKHRRWVKLKRSFKLTTFEKKLNILFRGVICTILKVEIIFKLNKTLTSRTPLRFCFVDIKIWERFLNSRAIIWFTPKRPGRGKLVQHFFVCCRCLC